MKQTAKYNISLVIFIFCTGLVLAACGDATTVPGTTPTASVTQAGSSPAATTAVATTLVSTTTATITTAPLTMTIAATAPSASTAAPTAAAAVLDVSKASATLQDLTFLKGIHDAFLSPDGSLLAVVDTPGKQICFYTIAGQKQACSPVRQSLDLNSVVWSPDGHYLAYTENFLQYFQDPDIWLIEVASGKATDLTEDNVTKYQLGAPTPGAAVGLTDQLPVFTMDSRHILFLRYPDTSRGLVIPQLYSIDLLGGQPTQIGEFEQGEGLGNTLGYALSPDGKHIAYTVAKPKVTDVKNGLWLGNQTGKDTLQLLSSPDVSASRKQAGAIYLNNTAFSADGNYIFGQATVNADGGAVYDNDNIFVFTSTGQRITPVNPDTPIHWAAWSPTGSALLALVQDGTANITKKVKKAGIYLLDKPGGKSVQLADGNYIPPAMSATWRGPLWASNNTVLVRRQSDLQLVLLQLTIK